MNTFEKIVALLEKNHANFRVIEHPPEGRTELISAIRGNAPEQAAKAMVLQVIAGAAPVRYVLAIIPGDSKVNFKAVAKLMDGKKSSFAPPEVAQELTQCVMGAVPPFSFASELALLVDQRMRSAGELFFNAGELDKSIALNADDYFRVVGTECCGEISAPVTANA
ncbi:Ala-tRNA(Pro) deacylase [Erwinia toletana]|uniref:Ala-tRNA(Pro) deacylase n=1 Tax=Winslowiella toletana TaxID=92490 RepID=A0ABS4P8M5_9GAMM|nr:YbaK/EbsC family protein [Winslowiella toletana]MBP2168991.1 Ala-tRNA(Pro) deacylase [Winslowiella toletana]